MWATKWRKLVFETDARLCRAWARSAFVEIAGEGWCSGFGLQNLELLKAQMKIMREDKDELYHDDHTDTINGTDDDGGDDDDDDDDGGDGDDSGGDDDDEDEDAEVEDDTDEHHGGTQENRSFSKSRNVQVWWS